MVLKSQFVGQQLDLLFAEERQYLRHGVVPPSQATQVGLLLVKILCSQMHVCQGLPHGRAMGQAGLHLRFALQAVHNRSRFIKQSQQNITLAVGLRVGHCDATLGQVFHQIQIKRQLRMAESLEHREDILALIGGQKIVGVFNAAADALEGHQVADRELGQQVAGLLFRDFGENGHE